MPIGQTGANAMKKAQRLQSAGKKTESLRPPRHNTNRLQSAAIPFQDSIQKAVSQAGIRSHSRGGSAKTNSKQRRLVVKCEEAIQDHQTVGQQVSIEDVSQSLNSLKRDYNRVKDDNVKYKTRNAQLETLVNTLYSDLHEQQAEIDKIYSNKAGAKMEFYSSSLAQSLKRQIRDERTVNKLLQDEIYNLKKSANKTNEKELKVELKMYEQELIRLRKMLDKEVKFGYGNMKDLETNVQDLCDKMSTEQDKRQLATLLAQKELEKQQFLQEIKNRQALLDRSNHKLTIIDDVNKAEKQEIGKRFNFLVQAKTDQLKMLQDQYNSVFKIKTDQHARILELQAQNHDLLTQVDRLQIQARRPQGSPTKSRSQKFGGHSSRQPSVIELSQSPSPKRYINLKSMINDQAEGSPPLQTEHESRNCLLDKNEVPQIQRGSTQVVNNDTQEQYQKSLLSNQDEFHQPSIIKQNTVQPKAVQQEQQQNSNPKQQDDGKSSEGGIRMPLSFATNEYQESISTQFFKKTKISNVDLVCKGIKNFKALIESEEQPKTDIEMAFYQAYGQEIRKLYKRLQSEEVSITKHVFRSIYLDKVTLNDSDTFEDQLKMLAQRWSIHATELEVCKLITSMVIPCIREWRVIDQSSLFDAIEQQFRDDTRTPIKNDSSYSLPVLHSELQNQSGTHRTEQPQLDKEKQEKDYVSEEVNDSQRQVNNRNQSETPLSMQIGSALKESKDASEKTDQTGASPEHKNIMIQQQNTESIVDSDQKQLDPALPVKEFQPTTTEALLEDSREVEKETQKDQSDFELEDNVNQSVSSTSRISPAKEPPANEPPQEESVAEVQEQSNITEDQMLDIAELILNQLAELLEQNNWTVYDVFGQPDEIIRIIPEFEGETNIKVINPDFFLSRLYQVGLQDLSELQVACLMRVLSKQEFEDAIKYSELEQLMENFGVTNSEVQNDFTDQMQMDEDDGRQADAAADENPDDNFSQNPEKAETSQNDSKINFNPKQSVVAQEEKKEDFFKQVEGSDAERGDSASEKSNEILFIDDNKGKRLDFKFGDEKFAHDDSVEDVDASRSELRSKTGSSESVKRNRSIQNIRSNRSGCLKQPSLFSGTTSPLHKRAESEMNLAIHVPSSLRSSLKAPKKLTVLHQQQSSCKSIKSVKIHDKSIDATSEIGQHSGRRQFTKEVHPERKIALAPSEQRRQSDRMSQEQISNALQEANVIQPDWMSESDGNLNTLEMMQALEINKSQDRKAKEQSNQQKPRSTQIMSAIQASLAKQFNRVMTSIQEDVVGEVANDFSKNNNSFHTDVNESGLHMQDQVSPQPAQQKKALNRGQSHQNLQASVTSVDEIRNMTNRDEKNRLKLSNLVNEGFGRYEEHISPQFNSSNEPWNQRVDAASGDYQQTQPIEQTSFAEKIQLIKDGHSPAEIAKPPMPKPGQKPSENRKILRQQIVSQGMSNSVFELIRDVLRRLKINELLSFIDNEGFKQQIKVKNKQPTETEIITQEAFLNLMYMRSDVRLSDVDLDKLTDCVQLTAKFKNLYTIKILKQLIADVEYEMKLASGGGSFKRLLHDAAHKQ